jgi:hypothetical protein
MIPYSPVSNGGGYARNGRVERIFVQLCGSGGAGSGNAPASQVRAIVNAALAKLFSADGRRSIPPERLLRAALIQILFSIRSDRQLMDQMQYNLLFRLFVGLGIDDRSGCRPYSPRTETGF